MPRLSGACQGVRSAWVKAQLLERMAEQAIDPASVPLAAHRGYGRALTVERIVLRYLAAVPRRAAPALASAGVPPTDWLMYVTTLLLLAHVDARGPYLSARDAEVLTGLPALAAAAAKRLEAFEGGAARPGRIARTLRSAALPPTPSPSPPTAHGAAAATAAVSPLVPPWRDTLLLLAAVGGVGL
jgi:hypothetical protein